MWREYLRQMWFDLKTRPRRPRFQSRYMYREFIEEDEKHQKLSEQRYAEYREKRGAHDTKSDIENNPNKMDFVNWRA